MSENNEIIIGTSALLLTFRCNLRCKLCCTTTPQMPMERQVDFPLENLQAVLKRYFEVVKYIRKLSFGGGEPTLYKRLPELIEYTVQFREQFEVFEIITNGVALPRKEILDTAEKYKDVIFFMIDDYGEDKSLHVREVVEQFENRGIRYKVRCYHGEQAHEGGWVDLGDFTHKHSKEEASILMSKCCISSKKKNHTGVKDSLNEENDAAYYLPYAANTNGLVHRCARAYSTLQAGAISKKSGCFVNIMDGNKTVKEIRQEIISMFSDHSYEACEYCNGFDESSKRYEPAEQITGR